MVPVGDLLGKPGTERPFSGQRPVSLRLGETRVENLMTVAGAVLGMSDSVRASFEVSATASMTCVRCTKTWQEGVVVEAQQYFGLVADDDGYAIVDAFVDMGPPALDELALALPPAPRCRIDCMGLCPACGNDLNTDPCDGHGEDSASPFSVLKDLFDS